MKRHDQVRKARDQADAARFRWWFGTGADRVKQDLVPEYLPGLRPLGWSIDQWRAAIESAMHAEEDRAEDADLNRKLREMRASGWGMK